MLVKPQTTDGSTSKDLHGMDRNMLYDERYYCSECEGHEEFVLSQGRSLTKRLKQSLAHIDVQPGMLVLDAGCGRGESLVWLSARQVEVWGIDYSGKALQLAQSALSSTSVESQKTAHLSLANVCQLPFAMHTFDRVLMLDVVEHLYPWELRLALREAWRVLKPNGKLIVHTAPNLWYYRYGYPLYRLFMRLYGTNLPRDPRDRFRYHRLVHVNEQSPTTLKHALEDAGFRPRIWVTDIQQRWAEHGTLAYALGWLVTNLPLIKWVFCGDILAEGYK